MRELTWNDELAWGAQLWANQCNFGHDSASTCKYYVGQNLYISWSTYGSGEPDWERAIKAWYDEVSI